MAGQSERHSEYSALFRKHPVPSGQTAVPTSLHLANGAKTIGPVAVAFDASSLQIQPEKIILA